FHRVHPLATHEQPSRRLPIEHDLRYGHRSPPCTDSPRGRHGAAPPGPRVPTTSGRLTPTPADVREDRPRPRAPQRRSSRTPVLASGSLTLEDRLPLLRVRG